MCSTVELLDAQQWCFSLFEVVTSDPSSGLTSPILVRLRLNDGGMAPPHILVPKRQSRVSGAGIHGFACVNTLHGCSSNREPKM